jgi:hypothetical protein
MYMYLYTCVCVKIIYSEEHYPWGTAADSGPLAMLTAWTPSQLHQLKLKTENNEDRTSTNHLVFVISIRMYRYVIFESQKKANHDSKVSILRNSIFLSSTRMPPRLGGYVGHCWVVHLLVAYAVQKLMAFEDDFDQINVRLKYHMIREICDEEKGECQTICVPSPDNIADCHSKAVSVAIWNKLTPKCGRP